MDYKQVAGVIRWHAMYSALSGAEARLIMFMATGSNHKTSRIQASHTELAKAVGLSKAATTKAIKTLEQKKAITVDGPASGRTVATYRIRTAGDLEGYFLMEKNNPALDEWYDMHERFNQLEATRDSIGVDCETCSEDEGICAMHQFKIKQLEESLDWREYQLWLADNPRPPAKIKTISPHNMIQKKDQA